MINTIYTILISVLTALGGGFSGWFFTRKKYKTEVDSNVIHNLEKSFDVFSKTINFCEQRIEELTKELIACKEENKKLEKELYAVKDRTLKIIEMVCVNLTCTLRKRNFDLFGNEDNSTQEI